MSNTDFTNFNISGKVNGINVSFTKDESNISFDENSEAYLYYSQEMSAQISAFEDIDVNNLNALSQDDISLLDVMEIVEDHSVYLQTETIEDESILTFKKNGAVVEMSNTMEFNLVEYETACQAAS